jgi:U3 small nucleolar RNA-associated protein MPP10
LVAVQNNFDDVVRRREMDDKAFLPSRFFELQDTQSSRSLAQIYEDEFTAASTAAAGGKIVDPRDAKLQKEHEEIDRLWGEISYTLDALSNLNYTPKQVSRGVCRS